MKEVYETKKNYIKIGLLSEQHDARKPVFATTVQQTAQGSLGSVPEEFQMTYLIPGEKGNIF